MDKQFQAEYQKLNAAQRQAVETIDGPMLVVAGPGTGKTQLLGMRVANILKRTDTDASNILCLTFTNKAATNMRERLYQLIGPGGRSVVVRTFHSFAAEIMSQYPDYFWEGTRLSVAPDAVQLEIIQSILAALPLNNQLASNFAGAFTQLGDVKEALKLAKEAGLTPSDLRQIIEANLRYINSIEAKLAELLASNLNIKKLGQLVASINKLPEQKVPASSLLLPLSSVIKDSLVLAVDQDEASGKTTRTGKWKQRWIQTIDGQKGMFKERQRNAWWLAIADVYESYREQLHQRGYYDYSDMLIEVLIQLEQNPDIRADVQERFLYVLIDEFQDTNAAQLKLAHLVADHYAANNRPNLMAVGDDDQSIFAFNGAELNNMLSFRRSYPDTKLVVLEDNYRSAQAILDVAGAIIGLAEDRLVKRDPKLVKNLKANNAPRAKTIIEHLSYPTRQHQQLAVAEKIREFWQDDNGSIAVLARKHESLERLADILLKKQVPVVYERRNNVLENEAVKQAYLIAQTVAAIAQGDKNSVNFLLSQLLKHPMWQIIPLSLWRLGSANYSTPNWLESLLDSQDKQLNSVGNWLVWLARSAQDQPVALSLEYILGLRQGSYLLSPLKQYFLSTQPATSNYLETLSATSLLISLSQEFARPSQATLVDFVKFIELNLSTDRIIADESWFMTGQRAVQLLTVHKAKGLEFDNVFVIDATEDMWRPRSGGRHSPANLQLQSYFDNYDDFVRLLYVAVSRAKSMLIATSYFTNDRGEELLPTPLLSALPLRVVDDDPPLPAIETLESGLAWPELNSKDERSVLSHRLDEFYLSATSLTDFLNLVEAGPKSFKERHLLRLPTARSAQGGYGTAIHAALQTAQRLVNTSKLNLDAVMDRFEASLADQNMPPLDFERYQAKGEALLKKLFVDKLLDLPKGSLAELKLRDIFIDNARLGGNLDRIDTPSKNELTITDYKTGKALASFDTKDKTKALKSWRHKTQLTFYCLLARNSSRFAKAHDIRGQMIYLEAEKPSQLTLVFEPSTQDLDRLSQLAVAVWSHVMDLNFPDTSKYSEDINGIHQFEQALIDGTI